MKALLPQPGGFEGSVPVHEDPHAPDPAVCKVVDICHREVIVDSTGAPAHGGLEKAEDPIRADALQALDGQPEVRPSILDIGEKAPNAASAFVGTLDLGGRRKQLDVLRAASKVAVDVSLIQGGNGPLHDLHVLLRHRLRSISRPAVAQRRRKRDFCFRVKAALLPFAQSRSESGCGFDWRR
jgi:hypothetical protein